MDHVCFTMLTHVVDVLLTSRRTCILIIPDWAKNENKQTPPALCSKHRPTGSARPCILSAASRQAHEPLYVVVAKIGKLYISAN